MNPKEDNLRKAWSPVAANDIFSHLGTLAMVQPPNYYAISFVDQTPHIMTRCFKKRSSCLIAYPTATSYHCLKGAVGSSSKTLSVSISCTPARQRILFRLKRFANFNVVALNKNLAEVATLWDSPIYHPTQFWPNQVCPSCSASSTSFAAGASRGLWRRPDRTGGPNWDAISRC